MDKLKSFQVSCINDDTGDPIYTNYEVNATDSTRAKLKADKENEETVNRLNIVGLRRRYVISPVES